MLERNSVCIIGGSDGKDLVRVTRSPDHEIPIDISPDGSRIVFLRAEAGSDPPTGPHYVDTTISQIALSIGSDMSLCDTNVYGMVTGGA